MTGKNWVRLKRIPCSCGFCGHKFTLCPSDYRKRVKKNKCGLVFCKNKCYHDWMHGRHSNQHEDLAILKMENEILQLKIEMTKKAKRIVLLYNNITTIEMEKGNGIGVAINGV